MGSRDLDIKNLFIGPTIGPIKSRIIEVDIYICIITKICPQIKERKRKRKEERLLHFIYYEDKKVQIIKELMEHIE